MPLTAMEVRSLKPRERIYKVSDSGGLQVVVQPTGQRFWRYAFVPVHELREDSDVDHRAFGVEQRRHEALA